MPEEPNALAWTPEQMRGRITVALYAQRVLKEFTGVNEFHVKTSK